jgi:outer membrane autotransporter protein
MQFATDGYRIEGDGIELDADESLIRVGDGSAGGAGYTATITSALTGTGRLVKTDLGTLILTGANSYEGGTEIRHGVLVGDTASIAGDVHNDARLVFDQGFDGRFAGSLSGSGAAMKDGAGTLTLAGASVQDWSIAAGELSVGTAAFSGDISVDAGASFRFDPAIDTAWAGMLSGAGDFSKSGAAALTLTGNSADFAGTTSVTGGMLVVDGTLGGLLTVGANGTVAGSGRIGALTLGAGGSVAPGNSIGTLDIAGDLTIAAGSLYEVETDPVGTASDRIAVGGTAALNGGTVQHVGLPGAYAPVSTYTILTAAGGITGRFDAVDSDFAFLEARLDYASDAVRLVLERNDISFAGIGQTVNQRATAGAIEAGGWGAPLYDAAVGLNEADARGAFDRLSGELHASLRSALVEDSARVRGLLVRRLPEAGAGRQGVTMWAQVHGAASDLSTDGNAASLHSRTGGLWLGAEAVSPDLVFGLAFGAERSTHDAPAGNGEAEREGYRLAAYGARYWGTFKLSGGFAAAWDDIETARTATFPDFANTLDAGYDARTAQAFVEAGWSIPAGAGAIEPYAALAHVRAESDAFSETGGSAALTVDSQDQAVTFATLGLGTRRTLDFGQGRTAEIGGRIGWRHAMGDLTPHNRQAFDTGTIFTVEGLPIEDNALMVEFASQIRIRDALTLHIDWTGQIGNRHTAQHLSATLSWRF